MRLRSIGATTITLAALTLVPQAAAHAAVCPSPGSLPSAPATPESEYYAPKDPRLGPNPLPSAAPIAGFINGYKRFGTLSEDQWRTQFLTEKGFKYPDFDGFAKKDGKPIRQRTTLTPGTPLDRFGYTSGAFLGKGGDSFGSRALPPQGLVTPDGMAPDYQGNFRIGNAIVPPSNYHKYCVRYPFDVDSGPIADYFGQSGGGTQFVLMPNYVPGQPANGKDGRPMIEWLLHNGPANVNAKGLDAAYLVEVAP